MRGQLLVLITLYAAASSICNAQQWQSHPAPKSTYHSYGNGSVSCGSWVADRNTRSHFSEEQWVLGYVSAVGYYDVFELKHTNEAHVGFNLYIDNYCHQHPLSDIEEATQHLVEDLRTDKPAQ